jgi:hypothetical protein
MKKIDELCENKYTKFNNCAEEDNSMAVVDCMVDFVLVVVVEKEDNCLVEVDSY